MPLTVRTRGAVPARARAGFSLARWLIGGPGSRPDLWLINLRWIAIAGMLLTSVAGTRLAPRLALGPLYAVLAVVASVNFAWTIALRRDRPVGNTVAAQILIDVALLGAMLWFSGGLTNPFASFLTFHIVLAGLLDSRRTILWALVATGSVAVGLYWAAPLPLSDGPMKVDTLKVLAGAVSVVALGAITGFFVTLFTRQLDELREQTARSDRLAGLGRTVAAICHELNTPLGTIVIAAKDLLHVGREVGSTDVAELATVIVDEAQRASNTIGHMRGYVGMSEQREAVDLSEFVPRYAAQRLDQIGYQGHRSIGADAAGGPVTVHVLRSALCQVLSNVLSNAVEATEGVPAPAIEVTVAALREHATVTIHDNGVGVSAELAARLGEPFQTTKADRGGTGLGLYVSSLLADRMEGKLRLDSAPGEGTEVTLVLPRQGEANAGT